MAFWGVEVKPGKPFTHRYDDSKGRLHVSMATLGLGSSANAKSTLQCKLGNRRPVYLCSLYPRNTECLQLNLELEEHDKVVFSVIGPTSIHLSGYYLSTPPNANAIHHLDDSESYGEDIGETETDTSDCSDDEYDYDDSFIDDDPDPELFSTSPISAEEEATHDNIPKGKKGSFRRLRKKYQSVESDDDGCDEEKMIVDGSIDDQTKEIENKDSLPISSLWKKKGSGRVLDEEMNASIDRGAGDASNDNGTDGGTSTVETILKADPVLVDSQTHREAELSNHLEDPCTVVNVGDAKILKKKKNRKDKETKSSCNGHSIKLDNGIGGEPKTERMTQDFVEGNSQQQHAEEKETETTDKISPSSQVDHRQGKKLKKKRKERLKEAALLVATNASHNNLDLSQSHEYSKQHAVNDSFKMHEKVVEDSLDFQTDARQKRNNGKDNIDDTADENIKCRKKRRLKKHELQHENKMPQGDNEKKVDAESSGYVRQEHVDAIAIEKIKFTTKKKFLNKDEAYKRKTPDNTWKPPRFGLIQEDHLHDPWRVLVICVLLNRTTGEQVKKVLPEFFKLCPDAKSCTQVAREEIVKTIQSLGLHKRAEMIQRLSEDYLYKNWTYVTELHGIGKYGADAYAILVNGMWDRVTPSDHKLNSYWEFLHRIKDQL